MEFSRLDDPRHAKAAGEFIDSIVPNLFLMRYDPSSPARANSKSW
jgi:hypothetical protein